MKQDFTIYVVHAAFWAVFGLSLLIVRHSAPAPHPGGRGDLVAEAEIVAPNSRSLVALHTLAFAVMYWGVGEVVTSGRRVSPAEEIAGTLIIAAAAALTSSALLHFRSWRYRAKLDKGHRLATGGPFRIVRHPIYAGLDLLALGTAVWMPTLIACLGLVLMILGGDLRARAEERILERAFGDPYRSYCTQTKRFIPGVY